MKQINTQYLLFFNFLGASNLLIRPPKWAQYRREAEVGREVTYLKVKGKQSVLVWNIRRSQSNILHTPV